MSNNDLSNGPVDSNLSYNIKNNPSIFDAQGNSIHKINLVRSYLLAIAWNAPQFLNIILDYRNMGRSYYNQNPKIFSSTVKYDAVQHYQGKYSTVFLPSPGGRIPNSIEYVFPYNGVTKINLLKVFGQNQLPTQWSNVIYQDGVPKDIAVFNPATLSDNEKVLYYYIKHADFFTKMLNLMTRSFQNWSIQRYQTWTAEFPEDLYPGSKQDRTFLLTGEFLKAVYSQFLKESRYGNRYGFKLPAPRSVNSNYTIPVFNLTKGQLIQYINGQSDSFPI